MNVLKSFLSFLWAIFQAFPKFFRPVLSSVPYIGTILAFLPEIVGFVKSIASMLDRGITKDEIQRRVNGVSKAFENPNRSAAAGELEDAITFKG